MSRINIWTVIAILLVLFAVTRYLMHERETSLICANDPSAPACQRSAPTRRGLPRETFCAFELRVRASGPCKAVSVSSVGNCPRTDGGAVDRLDRAAHCGRRYCLRVSVGFVGPGLPSVKARLA